MRTHGLMLALLTLAVTPACKKDEAKPADPPAEKPATPAGDCSAVASSYMDGLRAQLEKASPEQGKRWEPIWPKAKQLLQETCEKDGWSADSLDCFKVGDSDCVAKLTERQRQNFEAVGEQINALVPRTEGKAETPSARVEPGDCAAAAQAYANKAKSAVAADSAMAKKWEPVWPKAIELIEAECTRSAWSAEVIACFKAAETLCDEKMTEPQTEGFNALGQQLAKLGEAAPAK